MTSMNEEKMRQASRSDVCKRCDGTGERFNNASEELTHCAVCCGAGVVLAHQNGRTGSHPCPRGCAAARPSVERDFKLEGVA